MFLSAARRVEAAVHPLASHPWPATEGRLASRQMADDLVHEGTTADEYGTELERVSRDLEAVEDAMRRLNDGTYGRCGQCGRELPEEQLSGDPLAKACAEHAASAAQ